MEMIFSHFCWQTKQAEEDFPTVGYYVAILLDVVSGQRYAVTASLKVYQGTFKKCMHFRWVAK